LIDFGINLFCHTDKGEYELSGEIELATGLKTEKTNGTAKNLL
jgi:hypothetical protein